MKESGITGLNTAEQNSMKLAELQIKNCLHTNDNTQIHSVALPILSNIRYPLCSTFTVREGCSVIIKTDPCQPCPLTDSIYLMNIYTLNWLALIFAHGAEKQHRKTSTNPFIQPDLCSPGNQNVHLKAREHPHQNPYNQLQTAQGLVLSSLRGSGQNVLPGADVPTDPAEPCCF